MAHTGPYRTFETFPIAWHTKPPMTPAVQYAFVVAVFVAGLSLGLIASITPASIPEPSSARAERPMCFDKILTQPNDDFSSYKCPFWDQSQHIVTLKGEGAVFCKCPNSKSLTPP